MGERGRVLGGGEGESHATHPPISPLCPPPPAEGIGRGWGGESYTTHPPKVPPSRGDRERGKC